MDLIHTLLSQLTGLIESMGYWGIFILTFIESTFVPLPSELVVIPAGYLAHQGVFDFSTLLAVSVVGTLTGSLFNYWLAYTLGRKLLIAYGDYMLMPKERFIKVEKFFNEHGSFSVFTGRLVMGVRHFIAFPAGLAKMPLDRFCLYTTLGGAVWMFILLSVGYAIGDQKELIKEYMHIINIGVIVFVIMAVVAYGLFYSVSKKRKELKVGFATIQPAHEAFEWEQKHVAPPKRERGPKVRMATIEPAHEAFELLEKRAHEKPARKKKKSTTKKSTAKKKTASKKPAAKKKTATKKTAAKKKPVKKAAAKRPQTKGKKRGGKK